MAETAAKNTPELSGNSGVHTPTGVHKMYGNASNYKYGKNKTKGNASSHGSGTTGARKPCYRCGDNHNPEYCKFKAYKCNNCQIKGHLAKVCRSKTKTRTDTSTAKLVSGTNQRSSDSSLPKSNVDFDMNDFPELGMYSVQENQKPSPSGNSSRSKFDKNAITVCVEIAGQSVEMEVDTGAAMAIIPEDVYQEKLARFVPLQSSSHTLHVYNGDKLGIVGQAKAQVKYQGQQHELPILVAKVGGQPPIMGRNWLQVFRLNWNQIFAVRRVSHGTHSTGNSNVNKVCNQHRAIFRILVR